MKQLHRFKDWISESETSEDDDFYFPADQDLAYINSHCSTLSELVKSGLSKGVELASIGTAHFITIDTESLVKYVNILDSIDVEMLPEVFKGNDIRITLLHSKDPKELGKYSLSEIGGKNRLSFNLTLRAKSRENFIKIVEDGMSEIIEDLKKVRFIIQVKRNLISSELKSELKKKVLEDYKSVIDDFFYKGETPELEKYNIGKLIASLYATDKKVLDTVRDITDEKVIDSIIKSLEAEDEDETVKLIKSVLKSERILKKL